MPASSIGDNDRWQPADRLSPPWPDGRPARVGVLSNPLSGSNRGGLGPIRQVVSRYPAVVHREARAPHEVFAALEAFAARDIDLIAINGGDGTIQAVLTGLLRRRPFRALPALALLYGGTSNMIAKDVGLKGPQHRVLGKLIKWAAAPDRSAVLVRRPVLRVAVDGRPPLFGMFFGAGCIYRGIEFFHSKVHTLGLRGELAHGIIVARFLSALLTRKTDLVAPTAMRVELDGCGPLPNRYLLLLISSLEKLILGLRPYWGGGCGPLHLTAVSAKPGHLVNAIAGFLRRGPNRYLQAHNGYHSHEIDAARLWFQGGFTLDGELFGTGAPQTPLTVSTGGYAFFVCQHG